MYWSLTTAPLLEDASHCWRTLAWKNNLWTLFYFLKSNKDHLISKWKSPESACHLKITIRTQKKTNKRIPILNGILSNCRGIWLSKLQTVYHHSHKNMPAMGRGGAKYILWSFKFIIIVIPPELIVCVIIQIISNSLFSSVQFSHSVMSDSLPP